MEEPITPSPTKESSLLIGYINLPTLLTLSGIILACLGVSFAVKGNIPAAAICLIYAGICDLFDGLVARKCRLSPQEQDYGIYIDTMADMASFGVAPAFILLNSGMTSPLEIGAMLIYTCCAATRLAYFNTLATKTDGPVPYFTGLPVTYAALLFPLVMYASFSPGNGLAPLPLVITLLVVAFLFILRIPIPKPRGILYIIFPLLAFAMTYLWWLEL